MSHPHTQHVPRWQIITAFAAVYIIWGSTYLAIRFAIDTMPPFFMAALRFLMAGALLFTWLRLRGVALPNRFHWRSGLIIGGLLLFGGNGGVTWAEQTVPSGIAALLVALVPLWVVIIDWLRPGGIRPTGPIIAGLVLGLVGMVLLIGPGNLAGGNAIDFAGTLALITATLCWSTGSVLSRHMPLPESPLMATATEMLGGALLLFIASALTGELPNVHLSQISLPSLLALGYLIIFGSIVAFSAYVWLLKVTSPARAATYAYVNPVVAVVLGWAFANETITLRTIIAAGIIITAVVVITTYRARAAIETAGEPAAVPVAEADKILNDHPA